MSARGPLSQTVLLAVATAGVFPTGCGKTCTPGQSIACAGAGGCSGGQVCAADGKQYGPCVCAAASPTTTPPTATPPTATTPVADAGPPVADAAPVAEVPRTSCAPRAGCEVECLAWTNNTDKSRFGLRMSSLDLTHPAALTRGMIKGLTTGRIQLSHQACDLAGLGTLSWLLELDRGAAKLHMGVAKPTSDPMRGYHFIRESINGVQVEPAEYDLTIAGDGRFTAAPPQGFILPVFLDPSAQSALLIPLRAVRIEGTLSPSQNCIGSHNAAGLSLDNNCMQDETTPAFLPGGRLEGHLTLEDADQIELVTLKQTLCTLLTGDAGAWGATDSAGTTRCKRDANNKVAFKGDWCSQSDGDATAGCADAVRLTATFAASAVTINP